MKRFLQDLTVTPSAPTVRAAFGLAALGVGLSVVLFACGPTPAIRTATGERIGGLSYEEHFPLSAEVRERTFHDDRLRKAVALMDDAGAIGLSGTYEAAGVLDTSTLVIAVRDTRDHERRLVLKNCAEPHVCAFFAEALAHGVVSRLPLVCRDSVPCATK